MKWRLWMAFPHFFRIILLFIYLNSSNCSIFTRNYTSNFTSNSNSKFFYSAPQFDISFANVTFGSTRFESNADSVSTFLSLGQMIANICQADLINRNLTDFSIDGVINLIYQDFPSLQSSGQAAIVQILANNLEVTDDSLKVLVRNNVNITGIVGIYDFGVAKINSLTTNGFGIPTISAGDLARSNPDNNFSGFSPSQDFTFFEIFDTLEYNSFDAILDLLKYFNWTLVGNIFNSNDYGYERQKDVDDYSANNSTPLFACQTIFYFNIRVNNDDGLDRFCSCILEKEIIQVIILWMGTSDAIALISNLRNRCSPSNDWTFVVADDFQTPLNYTPLGNIMKNSLLLRANGPWNMQNFVNECLDGASAYTSTIVNGLLKNLTQTGYNCTLIYDENLPVCTSLYRNEGKPCNCSPDLLSSDPYSSRFLFNADVISTYAEGVRLIANNCTLLNERIKFDDTARKLVPDFCKLTRFTPAILTLALRFVNITGYTGEIFFEKSSLTRSIKNFYLYSAYTDNLDAVLVGFLNSTLVQINNTAIQFVNGQVPISAVVPQNPDLSYPIVVVFFSLAIAEIIVCIAILVYFIIYRNNLSMRKTSPLITMMMTVGVIIMALARFFYSFGKTDFFCTFELYIYHIGFLLITSGILVKTYRVYRIFSNRTALALNISEVSLLIAAGLITGTLIVIITIFVAVFGIYAVVEQSPENIYYQFVVCRIPNETWDFIANLIIKLYALIVLVAALVFVWLTRNIQADYRETKALSAYAYTITAAFIILIPLNVTLQDSTDSEIIRYTIEMEFYSIVILAALGLLLLPKVYTIYRENNRREARDSIRNNQYG